MTHKNKDDGMEQNLFYLFLLDRLIWKVTSERAFDIKRRRD